MKKIFTEFWSECVKLYGYYSDYIHYIFPRELGDLVEYVLDIAIACLIIKIVADVAFKTKGNG